MRVVVFTGSLIILASERIELIVLLAVFARRAVFLLAEHAVEGGNAGEAGAHGDLRDGEAGLLQKLFRRPDAQAEQVAAEGIACVLLEES